MTASILTSLTVELVERIDEDLMAHYLGYIYEHYTYCAVCLILPLPVDLKFELQALQLFGLYSQSQLKLFPILFLSSS